MKVNIRCPTGGFGSLSYLAQLTKQILDCDVVISGEYKEGYYNILIDEGVSSVVYRRKAEVWWTDTPAMIPNTYHKIQQILEEENSLFIKHYTVSEFCKQHYRELGIPVEDTVIPRPINPILFNYSADYNDCEFDIMTIGKHCMCDRKNLRMQRDIFLEVGFRYCVISDVLMFKRDNLVQYDFGSVSDRMKAELLSKSRFLLWTSFVEGFGMPVLEAMAVGTVPIYTDVPAHNEFAVGIPIKPVDKIRSFCYGARIIKYVIDKEDVKEAVIYALGMNKEEWENLSWKCREKSAEIWNEFIDKIDLLVRA